MSDVEELTNIILKFRDERGWAQFHNSKDLALAISIEASELLELFLWKSDENADPEKLKEEPEKAKDLAETIIKNTHRTLMSRGMKWCYIYCTDKDTEEYIKEIV